MTLSEKRSFKNRTLYGTVCDASHSKAESLQYHSASYFPDSEAGAADAAAAADVAAVPMAAAPTVAAAAADAVAAADVAAAVDAAA
ncbi:hypothetical protein, partial [Hungatella hathewayi]|uniref:hypothetical protein n=3 Tax=Lachnospiraceae TaxID=186803 RepID=UPI0015F5608B